MRSSVWAALLRCIPPEQHNILMLVTTCGTEIALQNLLRIDEDFLAVRGRLAGSQDSGRLYFVPWDNIDYFGYNRMVNDEEFARVFGNLDLSPPAELPVASTTRRYGAPAAVPAKPEPPARNDTPAPSRGALPIKSTVLERFRSRGPGPSLNGVPKTPPRRPNPPGTHSQTPVSVNAKQSADGVPNRSGNGLGDTPVR